MKDENRMKQSLEASHAMEIIFSKVPRVAEERVSLGMAHGAILREEIFADQSMPPFDRSAMDGYAIQKEDCSESLLILEEIGMGTVPLQTVREGECSRIFTGGMIPGGADQVIPQEMVERKENRIHVLEKPRSSFIRYQGEDYRKGERLLKSGVRLGAIELSILASVGAIFPLVSIPVRVVHFTSGNEIVSPEQVPEAGQIRNTNSILMESLLSKSGVRVVHQGHLVEDFRRSMELLQQVDKEEFDLLLISGGASVGDHDYSKRILQELGFELIFGSLNLRPGKPLVFGVRGRQLCFAIPGNPVSHFVIYHRFLKSVISKMEGGGEELNWREGVLTEGIREGKNSRHTLWPVKVEWERERGQYQITPLKWNSSGDLRGLLECNGLLDIKAEGPEIQKGGEGVFLML